MAIQQATRATPRLDLGEAFKEYMASQTNFIGAQVLPVVDVPKRTGTFTKMTRESMLKRQRASRGTTGAYNRIDTYSEDDTYKCLEYGLEGKLGDDQRADFAMDLDAEEAISVPVWMGLLIEYEIRVKTAVFDTTTWTGASLFTDNSGSPWSTAATGIIGQVLAAKEKVRLNTGMNPNTLIIGAASLANMLANTGIKAQFPGAALITVQMIEQALPSIFGLERLIVGGQVYDTSGEGTAFSGDDIWAKTYAMVARLASPNAPITTPGIGRTFLWVGDTPELLTADEYYEDQTRSQIYRYRQYVDELIIDENFGHLMQIEA